MKRMKNTKKIKRKSKEIIRNFVFIYTYYMQHATLNIQHTFTNTNTHAYIYIFSSEINMLNIHTSQKKLTKT